MRRADSIKPWARIRRVNEQKYRSRISRRPTPASPTLARQCRAKEWRVVVMKNQGSNSRSGWIREASRYGREI